MKKTAVHCDRLFTHKLSSKDTNIPQLEGLLVFVHKADIVLIHRDESSCSSFECTTLT